VASKLKEDVRRERKASDAGDGPDLRVGIKVGEGDLEVDRGGEEGRGEDDRGLRGRQSGSVVRY
jgi:hypothetical protein